VERPTPPLPGDAAEREAQVRAGIAEIKAADPAFDAEVFMEQVRSEFLNVKQALSAGAPEQLRTYASPDLFQTWMAEGERQRESGVRVESRELEIEDTRLMWVFHGTAQDEITVGIDAACAVVGVREETGQVVFGQPGHAQPVTEYWTLLRPAGTPSAPPRPVALQCPHCGAPLGRGPAAICQYCSGLLPPPLEGWEIARIDQSLQWLERPVDPAEVARRREEQSWDDGLDAFLRGGL